MSENYHENENENKTEADRCGSENPPEARDPEGAKTALETEAESPAVEREKEMSANGTKKRGLPKYLLAAIVAVAAVLIVLAVVLIVNLVRDRRAPALSEVKERFTALIAASPEINTILFGRGLPTYPRVYEQRTPHTVTFDGNEYTVYTYTFEDSAVGTVVGYQYYVRIP